MSTDERVAAPDGEAEATQPPVVLPPEPWAFPEPARSTLANGVELVVYDIPGQYVVSVRTVVPFGLSIEPRPVEGVATMMARLLDEGTAEHTPEEFAELLERKGIGLGASVSDNGLGVALDVAKGRLPEALDLLRQVLAEPVFPQSEVDRMIKTRLAEIEQERAMAAPRAAREFIATHFDQDDRASRPLAGTAESVRAMTRQDVVDFHARFVGPRGAVVVVAGDLHGVDVEALVTEALGPWTNPRQEAAAEPVEARRAPDANRVVLVDRPGSVQSELMVGWTGPDRRAAGGWAAYPVLSFVVGGSPNARVDAVLREEKGYTYGIRSGFRPRRVGGLFLTAGSVRADATVESVGLLLEILGDARKGFSPEEIRAGVDFMGKTAPGRFATADAVADEAANMAFEDLTTDFTTRTLREMQDLDADALVKAYAQWVTGEWTIVVVGDAGTHAEGIRELGVGAVSVVPA